MFWGRIRWTLLKRYGCPPPPKSIPWENNSLVQFTPSISPRSKNLGKTVDYLHCTPVRKILNRVHDHLHYLPFSRLQLGSACSNIISRNRWLLAQKTMLSMNRSIIGFQSRLEVELFPKNVSCSASPVRGFWHKIPWLLPHHWSEAEKLCGSVYFHQCSQSSSVLNSTAK